MTETLRRYCLCGGAATARSTPRAPAEDVMRMFDQLHSGEGHGPATARQAAAARRRNEEN
jgi:hypothetical protein